MGKAIDLSGNTYGKLTPISTKIRYTKGGNRIKYWVCRCVCGNITEVSTHDLVSGHTKSCSKCIYNVSPKVVHKRIFDAWRMMLARCENPKAQAYHNYGERGIKVCEEWHDFNAFLNWTLNNGYADALTIDRKNVNGDYCPENCRWVTDKVQSNNRRNNHFVEYNNETHTVSEWAELLKIPYSTLITRLSHGWSVKDAFEKPLKKYPRKKVV